MPSLPQPFALVCVALALACAALGTACDTGPAPPEDELLDDGAACARDDECASARCALLPLLAAGPPSPVCTRPCTDACAGGLGCAPVAVGDDGAVQHLCAPPGPRALGAVCARSLECASGLCASFVCSERCAADDACAANDRCEGALAVVAVVDAVGTDSDPGPARVDVDVCRTPPDARPVDLELGPLTTRADGPSDALVIDVPAGVVAFSVTLVAVDALVAGAVSLVAPDGVVLVDDVTVTDGVGSDAPLQHASRYFGATTTLVPGTDAPAAVVQAGAYRLQAATWDSLDPAAPLAAGTIERVVVRFTHAGDEGGLLDLALHFAPATGFTAALAAEDEAVAAAIESARALLALADVTLGAVAFHDLGAEHDLIEDGDAARALCVESSVAGDAGLAANVFLVDDLSFTAGFAGGIPGPAGLTGTPASGIVAETLGSGADTGVLLAHELGHFLGLRHTTEADGSADFLVDTPACPSGTDVDACPDHTNLMFPFFSLSEPLVVTPGQARVLAGSPFLREDRSTRLCPGVTAWDVTRDRRASARLGASTPSTPATPATPSAFAGSCGGDASPDRVHVYRLERDGRAALEVAVRAEGFAPLVHIREGDCFDTAAERACAVGTPGAELVVRLDDPAPGAFIIVVDADAADAAGAFELDVRELE